MSISHSNDISEDEENIREAYEQLYHKSFNVKKTNRAVLKTVNVLELEIEKLICGLQNSTESFSKLNAMMNPLETTVKTLTTDLKESTKSFSEFKVVEESLEPMVKTLTSDLEKSNTQLHSRNLTV